MEREIIYIESDPRVGVDSGQRGGFGGAEPYAGAAIGWVVMTVRIDV